MHAWTGFLDANTNLAGTTPRSTDLPVSVAALLLAEALRADNHAAANAVLIDAQAQIPIAQARGGGLLASVDGLRFVVTTDNASYSDIVFGLFAMLGYRFSPRFADLPDQRYGPVEAVFPAGG